MSGFFSQRNAPPPTAPRYDLPPHVRARIWAIISPNIGSGPSAGMFFNDLAALLRKQYGFLAKTAVSASQPNQHPVITHLMACNSEQSLDFVEACFKLNRCCGGQDAVEEINNAFQQEGVGYQLTAYRGPELTPGSMVIGQTTPDQDLPRFIRVDHRWMHMEIVVPALEFLSNPVFSVANREMLKAYTDYRNGGHDDAITACGSAFESVLKTICVQKGWAFDRENDTCSVLVDVCYKNDLFPSFYVELLKRVGTVRNKLGDAHGRGPIPHQEVDAAHAEHMLHMTAAHILLLAKLARLE
jgi:hypothetical protein